MMDAKDETALPATALGVARGQRIAAAGVAALIVAAGVALASSPDTQALTLSLAFGALFGFVLQRARFCFYCIWRDYIVARDPRGMLGILTALAVGLAGYTLVFGAWLPDPSGTRLPPDAHIGPVGPAVALAGLVFGFGMAVSGSCLSAHLYRLGEGSPVAPFALIGAMLGFVFGFLTWNPIYLAWVSASPVLWLPRHLGYGGALAAALAVLGLVALSLLRQWRPSPRAETPLAAIFVDRWPTWIGGLAIGAIGTATYLRVAPLGVTAEIGARSRAAANTLGLLPERLEGLDQFRGCATMIRDALLTPNGVFVMALVAAAFAAALAAGQFQPRRPTFRDAARGLGGGVLLGWGAMTGLGCTIGTLLSGISAGAVSGWVFGFAAYGGVWLALAVSRRLQRA